MSDEARGDQSVGSSFHRQGAAYLKERFVIFKEERESNQIAYRWAESAKYVDHPLMAATSSNLNRFSKFLTTAGEKLKFPIKYKRHKVRQNVSYLTKMMFLVTVLNKYGYCHSSFSKSLYAVRFPVLLRSLL